MGDILPAGPTIEHWKPIPNLDAVWELRGRHGPIPLRTVAIRLQSGTVCVYSPMPGASKAALDELAAMGSPLLLAPNAYHTLGLRPHADAFPGAPVVASPAAASRVRKKSGVDVADLEVLQSKMPADMALLQCPVGRSGEVWISMSGARRTWIVCDTFLNMPRLPAGPAGLFTRLMRMGPGLSIPTTLKLLLKHRSAYREWVLERIASERPTRLIPCHGQILEDDTLPARLEALVRERLS